MQQPIKGGAVNPQRQHREERLLIIEKTYDMLKYADQCVTQFPKKERYRTATGIMQCAWNLMDLFLEARYPEYRVAALRRADIELDKLRYKIRFAMDLTFLPCLAPGKGGWPSPTGTARVRAGYDDCPVSEGKQGCLRKGRLRGLGGFPEPGLKGDEGQIETLQRSIPPSL